MLRRRDAGCASSALAQPAAAKREEFETWAPDIRNRRMGAYMSTQLPQGAVSNKVVMASSVVASVCVGITEPSKKSGWRFQGIFRDIGSAFRRLIA
jgi:hypothetical protein